MFFRLTCFKLDNHVQNWIVHTLNRYCLKCTAWKNEKFSLTEKIFREINSLVTFLVKMLLSRNFCQKCVRVNFRYFHTVCLVAWSGYQHRASSHFLIFEWNKKIQYLIRNYYTIQARTNANLKGTKMMLT